jgi:phosphoribosylaminoimidazole-succinocarboxamide synthase
MPTAATSAVLTVSDDLPLRSERPVHSGKVRSVYWLGDEDSRRLIEARAYPVAEDSKLAVMVISDRLSAFDCLWQGETLPGVPGKGAALNRIAAHWFAELAGAGLPANHLLEMPHPMLWIVRQARPVRVEAIARQYLTGSLWRAYERGERSVGGARLPDGLQRFARLPELLFTPSTKGVLRGLDGVPEFDDAPVSEAALRRHYAAFGFAVEDDVDRCREAMLQGFECLAAGYARLDELLVDSKFEFGYAPNAAGEEELIYMDEVATPDSSRIWTRADWERGAPREHSKEQFREALLNWVPDPSLLLDSARMDERTAFASEQRLPDAFFEDLSATYCAIAERVTGQPAAPLDRPREAMLDILNEQFDLLS